MACERVGTAIVCGRSSHGKLGKCQECWVVDARVLCDGPRKPGSTFKRGIEGADKTCSKPLCRDCATHVAPDKDYCRDHNAPEKRKLAL